MLFDLIEDYEIGQQKNVDLPSPEQLKEIFAAKYDQLQGKTFYKQRTKYPWKPNHINVLLQKCLGGVYKL